jgi:hypothetical protein
VERLLLDRRRALPRKEALLDLRRRRSELPEGLPQEDVVDVGI